MITSTTEKWMWLRSLHPLSQLVLVQCARGFDDYRKNTGMTSGSCLIMNAITLIAILFFAELCCGTLSPPTGKNKKEKEKPNNKMFSIETW